MLGIDYTESILSQNFLFLDLKILLDLLSHDINIWAPFYSTTTSDPCLGHCISGNGVGYHWHGSYIIAQPTLHLAIKILLKYNITRGNGQSRDCNGNSQDLFALLQWVDIALVRRITPSFTHYSNNATPSLLHKGRAVEE